MSKLTDGVVFDVADWKVPVVSKHKLIQQPTIGVNITYDTQVLKDMPDKQIKIFEKSFEKEFDKKFYPMSNTWFSVVQEILDKNENAIKKFCEDPKNAKYSQAEAMKLFTEMVSKANAQIESLCKKWHKMAEVLVADLLNSAVAESIKQMKDKVKRAKVKVAVKVGLKVGLILSVTAVGMLLAAGIGAAGIALGFGIGVGAIIGIVGTGFKGLHSSCKVVYKNWDIVGNAIAKAEAEVEKLGKAVEAYRIASHPGAGKLDKLSAAKKIMSASVSATIKATDQLDKYVFDAQLKVDKHTKEMNMLIDELKKYDEGNKQFAKIKKDADKLDKDVGLLKVRIEKIKGIRAERENLVSAFNKDNMDEMHKIIGRLGDILKVVRTGVHGLRVLEAPASLVLSSAVDLVSIL
jgi:hypothetical protein